MGRKRRKGTDEADLPLEPPAPVRLSPERRAAKEHELHLAIRARTAVKGEKDESNRKFNTELDQYDESIKRLADELLMDTDLQKQRELFVSPDDAKRGLATVAAATLGGHPFVEPGADKVAAGEAPRCAFPECGRFVDEPPHDAVPHPYTGADGGPCACGEPQESACHEAADEPADEFRKAPPAEPHPFRAGPLRDGNTPLLHGLRRAGERRRPPRRQVDEATEGGGAGA